MIRLHFYVPITHFYCGKENIMKKHLNLLLAVLLFAAALTLGTLSDSHAKSTAWERIQKAGVIRVGNSPDYPPYESLDDAGKRIGFDIDLMTEISNILGVKVEYVTLDFAVIITAVQSGQVDLGLSGFSINEERKKAINFTAPYVASGQVVVGNVGSGIKSIDDLKGKKVALQMGTTGQKAGEEHLKECEFVLNEDSNLLFVMLKQHAVAAVVADIPVAEQYIKKGGYELIGEPLTFEENAMIVKKDHDVLLSKINEALAQIKASPKYAELLQKWAL